MNLHETLDIVLEQMLIGPCRALCKDDLKFRCQEISGHYPRPTEFEKVFESFRTPVNKYNLVYKPGLGWYRATTPASKRKAMERLDNQIIKRQQYKSALT